MSIQGIITSHGTAAAAACMDANEPLAITRAAFGSGTYPNGVSSPQALAAYAADGSIADRRREGNQLLLTAQYSTQANPNVPEFTIREIMLYCTDPDTGQETDFCYIPVGAYQQTAKPYSSTGVNCVFQFPITIPITSQLGVQVRSSAGLVTYSGLIRLLDSEGVGTSVHEISIPCLVGWQSSDEETNGQYGYHKDVAVEGCTERMVPSLIFPPESMPIATAAEIAPFVRSLDGKIRIYAKRQPVSAPSIKAILTLTGMLPYIRVLTQSSDGVYLDMEDLEQIDTLADQVTALQIRTAALEASAGQGGSSGSGSGSGGSGNSGIGSGVLTTSDIVTGQAVETLLNEILGGD